VQVQAEIGPESPDGRSLRIEERVNIRIAPENRTKPGLDYNGEPEIRTRAFEELQRRRGENTISERPQPDDKNAAAERHSIERRCHRITLLLDLGFVDQHHRDVVFDRVNAMALNAF
jgi:hypothetical protein